MSKNALIEIESSFPLTKILVIILVPLVLFGIIYTYFYIYKILTAKCSKCSAKPKLSLWKLWKFTAMPWSKIVLTCKNCGEKNKIK